MIKFCKIFIVLMVWVFNTSYKTPEHKYDQKIAEIEKNLKEAKKELSQVKLKLNK